MLTNRKITDTNIAQKGVVAAPDRLNGTAAQNKAIFDRLVREIVKEALNSVIDDLVAATGASEIGFTPITGISSTDVQAAIGALNTGTGAALSLKADKTETALYFKDISLNETTGVITLTRENGTTKSIDTALEKIVTNWSYDSQTQSLILTMKDGTTVSVPLSDFITETEFSDSDTIDFSVVNHVVTAAVKNASITDDMLSSTLKSLLIEYVNAASSSATAAAVSASSASVSATAAAASKASASSAATAAAGSATDAGISESNANASAAAAAVSESNASEYALNASESSTSANNAKTNAEISAANAATSAASSEASRQAVENMMVDAHQSETPTVTKTVIDGVVKLDFGLKTGDPGSDAEVTAANIQSALGYTPASDDNMQAAIEDIAALKLLGLYCDIDGYVCQRLEGEDGI